MRKSRSSAASVRDDLKLDRPDVGWYQVRKALEARNASGGLPPTSFRAACKALTESLHPLSGL